MQLVSKIFTPECPSVCAPCWILMSLSHFSLLLFIRLHVMKSTQLKPHISHISTVLSSIHLPHSSTFPPFSPHVLWSPSPSLHSPNPSFPTFSLVPTLFLSPLSFFLSIHTTESLLIICDLLKYIHCQSLSFPLSLTHFAFPLSVSLALSLCPAFYSENLALLIPSLWALSVSFVFLFCRIIWVPPSTSSLYRREVTNTVRHG